MFIPDAPITSESEDRLNRARFAHKLAETIRDWNRDESIVIALYGPWGSGKTSILNLAIDHISITTKDWKDKKSPLVIRFNAWNFSEQTQLIIAFFQQLYAEIGKVAPDKKKELKKKFGEIIKTLSGVEVIADIPFVGKWLEGGAKFAGLFFPDQTLDDQRNDLIKLFRDINRRVIIVVDDIDRLTEQEIHQLFQLIKVNADFPNTIYLVAFDRQVVEKALDTEQKVGGRDYLKKIVQVGFDIPSIESVFLEQYLSTELDKILASVNTDYWDPYRWGNLYHAGLKILFGSIRDVKRYVNGLAFNLRIASDEVNPIDFIGIEALRVFIPEVYAGIANNKMLFVAPSSLSSLHDGGNELKKKLDEIFATAETQKDIAQKISQQLFPQLESVNQNTYYGRELHGAWRREKRICATDVFDRYFILGVPIGEISRLELRLVLEAAEDKERLVGLFREYYQQDRLKRLLSWLDDIIDQLSDEGVFGFCQALLEYGDEIPDIRNGIFEMGTDIQITWLIHLAMLRIEDSQERFRWFLQQIKDGPSLFTAVQRLSLELPRQGEPNVKPLFEEENLLTLKEACVNKISAYAHSGQLLNVKSLPYVLFRWKEWLPDQKELSDWIDEIIKTPKSALSFLSGFLWQGGSYTYGDYVSKKEWKIDQKSLREFIDPQVLLAIIQRLTEEEISRSSDREKTSLRTFLDTSNQPDE